MELGMTRLGELQTESEAENLILTQTKSGVVLHTSSEQAAVTESLSCGRKGWPGTKTFNFFLFSLFPFV